MINQPASVHARNALIFALSWIGALPFGWEAVASLSLGGGIQVINLKGLEKSVGGLLQMASGGQRGGMQALLVLRLFLLFGMVGVALLTLPIQPLAFTLGLSTVVPAVLWHGVATRSSEGRT